MAKPIQSLINAALAAALEDGVNLDELRTVTLTGPACWPMPAAEAGKPPLHTNGSKGDEVTMPAREAIRLGVLGYIADVDPAKVAALHDALAGATVEELDDLEAYAATTLAAPPAPPSAPAAPDTPPPAPNPAAEGLAAFLPADATESGLSPVTDEALEAMGAGELVAHLGQFPGDADRVRELELERRPSTRRSTVLAAAGMTDDEVAAARVGA